MPSAIATEAIITRTAVIFTDTNKTFEGKPVAAAKVTSVPLLKRILIDLRRAKYTNVVVVSNEKNDDIDRVLENTSGEFRHFLFSDPEWREEVHRSIDPKVLVLTADQLSDFRTLRSLRETRTNPDRVLISFDKKAAAEQSYAEKRYVTENGKLVSREEAADAANANIYLFPRETVVGFDGYDIEYISGLAAELDAAGKAEYFDIQYGFVQPIVDRPSVRVAERRILRYVWKEVDGIHSSLSKRLLLPFIRVLLKTPITPNMVSLAGAVVAILSGYYFARGHYLLTVFAALLAYASSLLDHVDGSIARLKSQESTFGAYFDTVCDYIFYICFIVGITIGAYKGSENIFYLIMGGMTVFGVLVTLMTSSYQRHASENASLYSAEAHKKLEENIENPIIRFGRKTYFVTRREVLPYYIIFFAVIHFMEFIIFMSAIGANLFWMFHLYTNKLFRPEIRS